MNKFEKAKKEFYFNASKATVLQGELAFIEHPNTDMQGWYQKLKNSDGKPHYMSLTAPTPRTYRVVDLESSSKGEDKCGTITKVVKGSANIQYVLRRIINNLYVSDEYTIDLKPNYEAEIKALQEKKRRLSVVVDRYDTRISELQSGMNTIVRNIDEIEYRIRTLRPETKKGSVGIDYEQIEKHISYAVANASVPEWPLDPVLIPVPCFLRGRF